MTVNNLKPFTQPVTLFISNCHRLSKIKNLFPLTLILLTFTLTTQAQTWQWGRSAGGHAMGNEDEFTATAVDDSGNVYVAGKFKDLAMFDSLTVNAEGTNFDAFVAKYSCQGKLKWLRRIEGKGYCWIDELILDKNQNPIVAGEIGSNYPWDSVKIADTVFYATSRSFLLQIKSDGSRGWMYLPKTSRFGYSKLSLQKNGSILMIGSGGGVFIKGDTIPHGLFVAEFSDRGIPLWAKNIASTGIPYEFSLMKDGNIGFSLIIDGVDSVEVFGEKYYPNKIGFSVFGIMDNKANKVVLKETDTKSTNPNIVFVSGFKQYKKGYIAFGTAQRLGTYNGDTLFKPGGPRWKRGGYETFIMKLDKNLKREWHARTTSDFWTHAGQMKIDSKGIAYMTGYVAGKQYYPIDTITSTSRTDVSFMSYDLVKRKWLNVEMLNTTGDDKDLSFDLEIDNEDNVIIAGKYQGWMYFDPKGPNKDTLFMRGGNSNAFVLKYGSKTCPTPKPSIGVEYESIKFFINGFKMFPNPASSLVNIELNEELNNATLEVYSITGELLYQKALGNQKAHTLDVSSFNTGMYLIEIISNNTRWVERLVVE